MSRPKAYEPEQGYKYQIFCREVGKREWEYCDYAKDRAEKDYLIREYVLAYQGGFEFKAMRLPMKYWKEAV